jgi:UPF0716 family protein affecting phage T7 exclusion
VSEHRHIPEPGELIYRPRPSWAPALLAVGALGFVSGTYTGFIAPGFVYMIIGALIFLAAFRSLVRGAARDYFNLPRKQKAQSAALPVETISLPD